MFLSSLLRIIRPLWLREKLFWKFSGLRSGLAREWFERVPLRFGRGVTLALKPSDIGHQQIVVLGYVERDLSMRIQELASNGGLFVDVGANYGYYTCMWAAARAENRVVAFEASPRNLAMITLNVERNGLQSRVTIVPKAAGRESGRMHFSLGPEHETGWGGLSLSGGSNEVEIAVTTLDDHFASLPEGQVIDVLKVDTEGADTWVIMGAVKLLAQKRIKRLFFEENASRMEKLGIQVGEAPEFLGQHGYSVEPIGPDGWHAWV